jgi:phosphate transport system substrate-binding protein
MMAAKKNKTGISLFKKRMDFMKKKILLILVLCCAILVLCGCQKEPEETTTKGTIHLFFPESVAPAMSGEVTAFMNQYREAGANVTGESVTNEAAVNRFMKDTLRLTFSTRRLTVSEKEAATKVSPDFEEILVAYDGVAVVVNKKNAVEEMTTAEIKDILSGKTNRWNKLSHAKGMRGAVTIVLQDSADNALYLKSRLGLSQFTPALKNASSELEVIDAVAKDRTAIGFVSTAWLDSVKTSVKAVTLSSVGVESDTAYTVAPEAVGKFFSSHPAYIYQKYYPFWRTIYAYCRTPYSNIAAGFASYVAGAEGQKLLLSKGVVPGTQKIRLKPSQP